MSRNKFMFMVVLAILLVAGLATPALAQGLTPPSGFCTTPPPNNPGWQIAAGTARITTAPCGESGKYAFSRGGTVSKFTSWTVAENARGIDAVTYYYEGAVGVPTAAPAGGQVVMEDRIARLIRLDAVYRAQGVNAWMAAAGVQCAVNIEARQPEEETVTDGNGAHVVVSGVQVRGNCTNIPWPNILTTDRPNEVVLTGETRQHQPDLRNASVLYTNVGLRGQGTIWIDGSNWGQMNPGGVPPVSPTNVVPTSVPPTQPPAATYTPLPTLTPYPTVAAPTQTPVPSVPTATPTRVPAGPAGPTTPFPWELVLGGLLALLLLALLVIGVIWLIRKLRAAPPSPPVVALDITTAAALPNATHAVAYAPSALAAHGGTEPYTWVLLGAPAWLTINANSGQLGGTPPAAVPATNFGVTVTDSTGATFTKQFTVTVV